MTAGAVGTVLDRSYDATGKAVTMVQRPFSNQAANTELLENHRGMLETFNNQDLSDKTLSKSDEITLAKRLSHTASVYDPKKNVPEPLKYFTYQTGDPYMPGRVVNGIEVHLQKLGESSDSEKFVTLSIPFTTKTNKGYYDIRKGHQTLEGDKSRGNALIHAVDKCKSELLTKILPVYNLSTIREIFNDIDKLTPNTDNLDKRVREYKKIMYNYCREYLVRIQANDPLDIPRDTNKLYNSVESELYDMIDISEMKMKSKPPSMNIYENDRQIMINIMQGIIITLLTNNYKEYYPSNSTWGRNKTINESDRALEAIDENKSLIYNASNRIHFHKYKNIKRLLDGKRGYTYKDNIKILSWMPQARQTHDIFIGILGAAKDPTKVNKIITGIERCKEYTEDVQDVGLDLLERIRQLENIENSLTELLKYVEIKLHNDHSLHSENILPIMKIDLTNDKDYTIGDLIGELTRRDPSASRNYEEYIKNLNEAYDSIGGININNLALDNNYINRYSAISDHDELFNIFEETNPEEDGIKKVKIKSLFINQDYIDSVGEYLKNAGKPTEETDTIMSKLGEINKSTDEYYTEDKLKIKIGTKILLSTMNYSEKTKFKNKDGGAELSATFSPLARIRKSLIDGEMDRFKEKSYGENIKSWMNSSTTNDHENMVEIIYQCISNLQSSFNQENFIEPLRKLSLDGLFVDNPTMNPFIEILKKIKSIDKDQLINNVIETIEVTTVNSPAAVKVPETQLGGATRTYKNPMLRNQIRNKRGGQRIRTNRKNIKRHTRKVKTLKH